MREPRRILIFCLDNLGDVVFTSALVPALRSRFPLAHIALWCKAYSEPVAALIPGLDRIYAADPFWDRSPMRGKGKLGPFLRALLSVRRARYDVALVTTAHWRAPATMVVAGIPVRIGRERRHNRRLLTHVLPPLRHLLPAVSELGQLLEPLGITDVPTQYRLDAAPLAERRRQLRSNLPRTPLAAVHPFASDLRRRMPLDVWVRALTQFSALGLVPVCLGSAAELADLRAAAGLRPEWVFADDLGSNSISDLAALISLSAVYVGHDSGPLHIAAALGLPVVGVYTDRPDAARTFPQGPAPRCVLETRNGVTPSSEEIVGGVRTLWPGPAL